MSRQFGLGLRLAITVLLVVVAAWGSLWAYVEYEARRARLMLADISRIQVGDTEASTLPLVRRYGGFEWMPEYSLGTREEWLDKEEYDYQQRRGRFDYKYAIIISSFHYTILDTGEFTRAARAMRALRATIPPRLRAVLGIRDRRADAVLSIRAGHVQAVNTITVFAGRSRWYGQSWELAEMPSVDIRPRAYRIGSGALTMEDGGVTIDNYFTPKASDEEIAAAHEFNTGCLTSIKGCDGLCEVAPRTLEYLTRHPDAGLNIIPPKCP